MTHFEEYYEVVFDILLVEKVENGSDFESIWKVLENNKDKQCYGSF